MVKVGWGNSFEFQMANNSTSKSIFKSSLARKLETVVFKNLSSTLSKMSSLVVPSGVCTARLKPIAGHAARARNWRSLRGTKGLLILQYVNWFMYLLTFWHLFWKLERRFWFLGFCPIPQIKCLNRLSVFSRTFFRWPNWTHFGVLIKMWLNVGNVQKPKVEKQVLFVCNNWIIKWITTNRFWLIASWLTLIVILSKKTKYHV